MIDEQLAVLGSFMKEGAYRTLRSEFADMGVAEEEIARAVQEHPKRATEINAAFLCYQRSPLAIEFPETIYRYHLRELIERIVQTKPLSKGTRPEMLWILQGASLKAPLRRPYMSVQVFLFEQMVGPDFWKKIPALGAITQEEIGYDHEGQRDEIINELWKLSWNSRRFELWDKGRYPKTNIPGAK